MTINRVMIVSYDLDVDCDPDVNSIMIVNYEFAVYHSFKSATYVPLASLLVKLTPSGRLSSMIKS